MKLIENDLPLDQYSVRTVWPTPDVKLTAWDGVGGHDVYFGIEGEAGVKASIPKRELAELVKTFDVVPEVLELTAMKERIAKLADRLFRISRWHWTHGNKKTAFAQAWAERQLRRIVCGLDIETEQEPELPQAAGAGIKARAKTFPGDVQYEFRRFSDGSWHSEIHIAKNDEELLRAFKVIKVLP